MDPVQNKNDRHPYTTPKHCLTYLLLHKDSLHRGRHLLGSKSIMRWFLTRLFNASSIVTPFASLCYNLRYRRDRRVRILYWCERKAKRAIVELSLQVGGQLKGQVRLVCAARTR